MPRAWKSPVFCWILPKRTAHPAGRSQPWKPVSRQPRRLRRSRGVLAPTVGNLTRNPTPAAPVPFRAEPSQCLYVSTKTAGVDRARARRFRTNVMPSPDRYRNTLWIALAAWIGATAILTWLSYGDAARRIIASSYPQLGWL